MTREARLVLCVAACMKQGGSRGSGSGDSSGKNTGGSRAARPEDDDKSGSITMEMLYHLGKDILKEKGSALASSWTMNSFVQAIEMLRQGGLIATDQGPGQRTALRRARCILNVDVKDIRASLHGVPAKEMYLSLLG